MQRPINKEIRHYQEELFMGLTLRQMICSITAIGLAIGIYFLLKDAVEKETLSWLCMVAASPVALAGFFSYEGMNLEQYLWAVLDCAVIRSGVRVWKSENYFYNAMQKRHTKKNRGKKSCD